MLASAGLAGFVYGLSHVSEDGWNSAATPGPIGAGLVLLATFAR
ncbi:hypothetical protein [Streptomyces sp. NPDC058308]